MKTTSRRWFWIAFSGLTLVPQQVMFAAPPPAPAEIFLQLETGRDRRIISLEDLKKQLKSATVKVYNPSYQRKLTYRGFWIEDILRANHFPTGKEAQMVFVCRDGYTALLSNGWVGRHKWLLAYEETSGQWTPLIQGSQTISPGPWYLIGSKKESFGDFPWPYAVVGIRSVNGW